MEMNMIMQTQMRKRLANEFDEEFSQKQIRKQIEVLNMQSFAELWRLVVEAHYQDIVPYFLTEELLNELDLDHICYMTKDRAFPVAKDQEHDGERGIADRYMEIPYKKNKDRKFLFRLELKMVADALYAQTLIKDLRMLKDFYDAEGSSVVLVGHADEGFYRESCAGLLADGIEPDGGVCFDTINIHDEPEYNTIEGLPHLANHLLQAIWLYEHKEAYSKDVIYEKYNNVIWNLLRCKFDDKGFSCMVAFVSKCALSCLEDEQLYGFFINEVYEQYLIRDLMDAVNYLESDQYKQQSEAYHENNTKGAGRDPAKQKDTTKSYLARLLIRGGYFYDQVIAEIVALPVEKVAEIRQQVLEELA